MTLKNWCKDAKMSTTEELVRASPLTVNCAFKAVSKLRQLNEMSYVVQFNGLGKVSYVRDRPLHQRLRLTLCTHFATSVCIWRNHSKTNGSNKGLIAGKFCGLFVRVP